MRTAPLLALAVLVTVAGTAGGCGGGDGDRGDAATCPPVDDDTLAALRLAIDASLSSQPGRTIDFDVGTVECCYYFQPVPACVTWSATEVPGVTIDDQGVLAIGAAVPHGTVVTVTADVEGRRQVTIDVYVYTPEGNPLVGIWREVGQLECGGGGERTPADPINELWFHADGRVQVTWHPFELYVDYWGTYHYPVAGGALTITASGGNYLPSDIDGVGTATVAGGELTLRDLWLGTPPGDTTPAGCGHRFTR